MLKSDVEKTRVGVTIPSRVNDDFTVSCELRGYEKAGRITILMEQDVESFAQSIAGTHKAELPEYQFLKSYLKPTGSQ